MFLLLYSVVGQLGYGICQYPHIIAAWEWFPDHKGLITGIISAGYGFGTFVFAQVSTALVNP